MCWNWEVSLGFSIGIALGSLFIYKRRSYNLPGTDRDTFAAILTLNLAFVQFYEMLIWIWVYPLEADTSQCPKQNIVFTAMVYFHGVLCWPPIINTFCWKTTKGKQDYFAFSYLFGVIYTFLGIFDLFYSQFYLGYYTCGLDGKVFLRWQVALSQSRILPNGYDWFLFTVFPFVFYKPRPIGFIMIFYLTSTFAIPYILLSLGEAASIFCWLGVGVFLLFLFDPFVAAYVERKYPKLLEMDPFGPLLSKVEKFLGPSLFAYHNHISEEEYKMQKELDIEFTIRGSNETTALP